MPLIKGVGVGVADTVKIGPVMGDPPEGVTTIVPVVAPEGTGTTMLDALQLVGVAAVPLNFTVPAVDPRFPPEIVTGVPTGPAAGEMPLIKGVGVGDGPTVNGWDPEPVPGAEPPTVQLQESVCMPGLGDDTVVDKVCVSLE
jgi:hypothetical protein